MKPYFINPKPDLSQESVHFVVCVHGLDGKYVFVLFVQQCYSFLVSLHLESSWEPSSEKGKTRLI